MKTAMRIGAVAAVLTLVVAVVLPAHAANFKVGDFLARIADAKGLDGSTPIAAERALRGAGFNLPALDLRGDLTEGKVVAISTSIGIRVSTSNPEMAFTESQVSSYFSAFGSDLGTTPGDPGQSTTGIPNNGNGADPLLKGKGKKKGLTTPTDPI